MDTLNLVLVPIQKVKQAEILRRILYGPLASRGPVDPDFDPIGPNAHRTTHILKGAQALWVVVLRGSHSPYFGLYEGVEGGAARL